MKKTFIAMGLMLAVSALTNCSKEETAVAPEPQQGITLRAEYTPLEGDTRTVLDPATGKVSWDADDDLTVFVVEAGTTPTKWTNEKFTAKDPGQGTFDNTTLRLDAAKSYDWYIMSPYGQYVTNPVGKSGTTFQIGNQTQDHAAPTAHLTDVDVMTGTVQNLPESQLPTVTLRHLATLMRFTIVNREATAITPTTIEFEAPTGTVVGGRFAIDFATGTLTPSTKWNTTTLTLKNAPAIEPDGSYDVYMMMPPFTLATGAAFKITVNTDDGFSEQTRTMSREVKFEAGKINRATIEYVASRPETVTGDWTTALEAGTLGITGSSKEIYPSVMLDKLMWETAYTWGNGTKTYIGGSVSDGAQIGSSSNYCRKAVFSTAYYGSPVQTITVKAKGANAVNTAHDATITITVNGVAYTAEDNTITNNHKDFIFSVPAGSTPQTGEIVLSLNNPTAKGALYLKSITITANS